MVDILTQLGAPTPEFSGTLAHRSLEAVRRHLGMDVAYLSEFVGDHTHFREVDAPGLEHLIQVGDSKSLEDVYCRHILAGRLPELIPDTAAIPLCVSMPITAEVPIGAHVSVPIRRADGELYGMFCCLSAAPRPTLNDRDLHIVRAFATMVAEEIDRDHVARQVIAETKELVLRALEPGAFEIYLQPICALPGCEPLGYEALARFHLEPRRTPDKWFLDAAAVGLAETLECAAIDAALVALEKLPAPLTLSVNASPATVGSGAFTACIGNRDVSHLTLELTEHAIVEDYDLLKARIDPLRARGMQLAIDDAGAGFSGLQQILRLQPDIIKLDMALIRNIDADPARRALASAMQTFARQTGAVLVAEGVETQQELSTLAKLSVRRIQGFLLGRPAPIAEVLAGLGGSVHAATG